jgi:hypothetical protein
MKNNSKGRNLLYVVIGGIAAPYLYLFFLRPKIFQFEKKVEERLTKVTDGEIELMRKELEKGKLEIEKNKSQTRKI